MIRWKVFLPAVVMSALVVWFAIYRLDSWLKHQIENTVSAVTGTRTNISSLNLSLRKSRLQIERLQIASAKEEFQNAVDFSEIVIDFQSLPLLEKRFVIDDFSIKGIDWKTPRKTSGFLPEEKKDEKPSWFSEWADEAFDSLKKEMNELPVAKLGDFRIPSNAKEVLGQLNLESEKAFKESLIEIQRARTDWTDKLKALQDVSEYKEFYGQVKQATENLPQDPQAILDRVQTLKRVVEFFRGQQEKAGNLYGDIKQEYHNLEGMYDRATGAISKDYNRARSLVSLDQFNLENLSKVMFGPQWFDRAEQVFHYHSMIRHWAETLKTPAKEGVEIRQRAKGRDIIFITPKKKPSFVLAKSEFSVSGFEKKELGEVSQTYALKIDNLNSNPRLTGKPTSVDVEARFRNWVVGAFDLNLFWDYTSETPKDSYTLSADSIQASHWPVGIPKVFPIKIEKGVAKSKSQLQFTGDHMSWINRIDFRNVDWSLREVPQVGLLLPTLSELFKNIHSFFLEFELSRKNGVFGFAVRSDLDNKMSDSIQSIIQAKWKEFQEKLKRELDEKIQIVRQEAQKELQEFRNQAVAEVEKKLELAKQYQSEAENKIKDLERKAKELAENKAKSEVQKQIDNIKKDLPKPKIKLPF